MPKLTRQPSNLNPVQISNFKFSLKRAPNTIFKIQRANIPGLSFNSVDHATELKRIPIAGEEIDFDPLTISFLVDEDFNNYFEIWNWMMGLGFPATYNQFADLDSNKLNGEGQYSDATLSILTNKKNSNIDLEFHNIFPIQMTSVDFDITNEITTFAETTVTFMYEKFVYKRL